MLRNNTVALQTAVKEFNAFFAQFKGAFIERDDVLFRLKLALLTRQHVLVMGPPGTAKTAISTLVFSNIIGGDFFEVELTKFMTDDGLFGPYNVRRMRDEGVLVHNTEGMLPEANFARLGEFLDANVATQRSLLSALHERKLKRGQQHVDMPLMTAYCDTNTDAANFLARNPDSWAVLDRLLFITSVGYVADESSVTEMVRRYQSGRTTRINRQLPFEVIVTLSDLIVGQPSLFTDNLVFAYYGKAITLYRTRRAELLKDEKKRAGIIMPMISDRRVVIASQLAETAAVLSARLHVTFEDLELCGHALGSTKQEFELWKAILAELQPQYALEKNNNIKSAQNVAIEAIKSQLGAIDVNTDDVDVVRQSIDVIMGQLDEIVANDGAINAAVEEIRGACNNMRTELRARILSAHGLT